MSQRFSFTEGQNCPIIITDSITVVVWSHTPPITGPSYISLLPSSCGCSHSALLCHFCKGHLPFSNPSVHKSHFKPPLPVEAPFAGGLSSLVLLSLNLWGPIRRYSQTIYRSVSSIILGDQSWSVWSQQCLLWTCCWVTIVTPRGKLCGSPDLASASTFTVPKRNWVQREPRNSSHFRWRHNCAHTHVDESSDFTKVQSTISHNKVESHRQ